MIRGGQFDFKTTEREIIFKVELFNSIKQSHHKNQVIKFLKGSKMSLIHSQLTV